MIWSVRFVQRNDLALTFTSLQCSDWRPSRSSGLKAVRNCPHFRAASISRRKSIVFKKYFIARRIRHRLEQLDDRLLQDIGISRADIGRIAKGEAPKHRSWRDKPHDFC